MELSNIQNTILEATEPIIFVSSSAGSGKTKVLTEKVRQSIQKGKSVVAFTFTNMASGEMKKRLQVDNNDNLFIGTIHSYCAHLLLRNGVKEAVKYMNDEKFDGLFHLMQKHPECTPNIDICLCDEAQDSNEIQLKFIFEMLHAKEYFIVFDLRQCQPAGTKVLLSDKTEKNIEDLKIGDELIAYGQSGRILGGTAWNSAKIPITDIQKRTIPSTEKLVKITTETGKVSRYTKGHICLTQLCRFTDYNFLVYLMCDKEGRFRVGKSQLKNSNTAPWRAKMRAEECEKMWILDTFHTDKEARVYEDKISYKYSIPQITFQLDKTTYTKEDIDFIYEGLDTYKSAEQCLLDHNKDIQYPFASIDDNIHYASNAFNKCYACNILPKNMQVKEYIEDGHHRQKSVNISRMEYEDGYNEVFSLNVEPYHTYIADGIVTHNCIYGFAGSRPDLLQQYIRKFNAKVYSMNENYRCCPDVLRFAKSTLQKCSMTDDSIAIRQVRGTVAMKPYSEQLILDMINISKKYHKWAVLARTNAQVDTIKDYLADNGIPCDSFKQGDLKKEELDKKMEENTVKVLTVHSAKGLEWDYVACVGLNLWSPEECRVSYVGITRARDGVLWMTPQRKKRTKITNWE